MELTRNRQSSGAKTLDACALIRPKLASTLLTYALDHDEPRLVEHPQVVHHAEARHLGVCGAQRACRGRAPVELVEERPPGRVGKRLEDRVLLVHM